MPTPKAARDGVVPTGAPIVVTGGAGFVGCNVAHALLDRGERVIVLDDLSRPGAQYNLEWLTRRHADGVVHARGDIRDADFVLGVLAGCAGVFHLAAQVAVTDSLRDPRADFETNALGTLNVLEALRAAAPNAFLVYSSTNKVYGALDDVELEESATRYVPRAEAVRRYGVSEARPLDFVSPYGCSKGAADQYVLDYARSFGLHAVVLRLSCMYGPRQFGTEDQGWVAHFLWRAATRNSITVYGDGKQIRDILFIDDAVQAFLLAASTKSLRGRAFNVGGGSSNELSLRELLELIEESYANPTPVLFAPPRIGDQRYYVSDIREFATATGWAPKVNVREGLSRLREWIERACGGESPAPPTSSSVDRRMSP